MAKFGLVGVDGHGVVIESLLEVADRRVGRSGGRGGHFWHVVWFDAEFTDNRVEGIGRSQGDCSSSLTT